MWTELLGRWLADSPDAWRHGLDCYAAITAVVPLFVALLVALVGWAFAAVWLALGVVPAERWLVALLVLVSFAAVSLAVRAFVTALGRRRRPGWVVGLDRVARFDLAERDVGEEARDLARLASLGPRIPVGWIVTADAFERLASRGSSAATDGHAGFAARVRAAPRPARLARRLHSYLAAEAIACFELSASPCEAGVGAAPRVPEAALAWARDEGVAALERVMSQLRATTPAGERRAILVQARLPRERTVVAPSDELALAVAEGDELAAEIVRIHAAAERRLGGARRLELAIRAGEIWLERVSRG